MKTSCGCWGRGVSIYRLHHGYTNYTLLFAIRGQRMTYDWVSLKSASGVHDCKQCCTKPGRIADLPNGGRTVTDHGEHETRAYNGSLEPQRGPLAESECDTTLKLKAFVHYSYKSGVKG